MSTAKRSAGQYDRPPACAGERACLRGRGFVPVRSIITFAPLSALPGAENARQQICPHIPLLNHKSPARPGAGNARNLFAGVPCMMNHKFQSKLSENARNFFAGTSCTFESQTVPVSSLRKCPQFVCGHFRRAGNKDDRKRAVQRQEWDARGTAAGSHARLIQE